MTKAKETAFPCMRYHPKTGNYVVCNTDAEIPEGYVDDIKKVKGYDPYGTTEVARDSTRRPTPQEKDSSPKKDDPVKEDDDDEAGNDENSEDTEKPVTLETLGLTRKEALKLLKEAEVEVPKNPKNDDLASLIQTHFEEEDDNSE